MVFGGSLLYHMNTYTENNRQQLIVQKMGILVQRENYVSIYIACGKFAIIIERKLQWNRIRFLILCILYLCSLERC